MNIKKLYLSALFLGGFSLSVSAQYLDDLIRYSQPEQSATARFRAMGNAQNALGGDLSSIGGNPAGLGFFNQSDINIGFDYLNDLNKATYFGETTQQNIDKFIISHAGAVFHLPVRKQRGANLSQGWLNFNIGISYAQTNNFHTKTGYVGINPESSIADLMVETPGSVYNDFGWAAGMIDEHGNGGDIPMTMLDNRQEVYNTEQGIQSETNLSFGANYGNFLYIGASVGFARINHRFEHLYMEDGIIEDYSYIVTQNPGSRFTDQSDPIYYNLLQSNYYYDNEYVSATRGNGVNAKLGVIFKPTPMLQVGLSATTPTWYQMTNDFSDRFYIENDQLNGETTSFTDYDEWEETYFDYKYRSPYRFNGGVAVLFGRGLVSADVEFVDYASMRFSSNDRNTDDMMGTDIAQTLKGSANFRLGGEYLFTDNLLARAGFGYNGGPYKDFDSHTQLVSAGLGYRINNMYIDLAYQNVTQEYGHSPYTLESLASPVADINNTRNRVFMTLGFKF